MDLVAHRSRRAAVIGSGIAGLAAAAGLRRHGWQVDVFERAAALRDDGGVLLLWPNGLRALERLGLAGPVRARAVPYSRMQVYAWSGRMTLHVAAPEWRRLLGEVPLYIERKQLLAALRGELGQVGQHFGLAFDGLVERPGGLALQLRDHAGARISTADYQLLVGADGVSSAVSRWLGNGHARAPIGSLWLGRVRARGFDWLPPPGDVVIIHGRRFRVILGAVPLAGGHEALEWSVYDNLSGSLAHPQPLSFAQLQHALRSCALPVADLLAASPTHTRLTIAAREPPRIWQRHGVVLVGDAAHVSSPELGQGACQAFVGIAGLLDALQTAGSIDAALHRYEAEHRGPTTRVSHASTAVTMLAGLGGPLIDDARDALVHAGWTSVGRQLLRAIAGA